MNTNITAGKNSLEKALKTFEGIQRDLADLAKSNQGLAEDLAALSLSLRYARSAGYAWQLVFQLNEIALPVLIAAIDAAMKRAVENDSNLDTGRVRAYYTVATSETEPLGKRVGAARVAFKLVRTILYNQYKVRCEAKAVQQSLKLAVQAAAGAKAPKRKAARRQEQLTLTYHYRGGGIQATSTKGKGPRS